MFSFFPNFVLSIHVKPEKMKSVRLLFMIGISMLICFACSSKASKNQPQADSTATVEIAPQVLPVSTQLLAGYFLKNTYKVNDDVDCILFPDQASFDKVLGIAKTMTNKVDKPNFEKNIVAAIALKPTKKNTEISISKAEKVNEAINIYLEQTIGEDLTYTMTPLKVFSFPKESGVSTVNFMMGAKVIKSFPLNVPATN